MISGILAGRIPGFHIKLCCFLHPLKWPIVILWLVLLLFCFMGLRQHGTQVVICMRRDDTLLSPLASIDLFHPLTGFCHVTAWCFVFVCFLCVLFFVFVFGVVVAFVSLCFVFCFDERDSTLDYVSVLYQFTFAATTASALA